MDSLFISPHNDDETLFGAYSIMAFKPTVLTVLESVVQEQRYGITAAVRQTENAQALWWLGDPEWIQWSGEGFRDNKPDFRMIAVKLGFFLKDRQFERVFAPAVEEGGHEQHNAIGAIARRLVRGDRLVQYCTYRRGSARTRTENEVHRQDDWPAKKLRAMACYTSQVNLDNTRPWFYDWDREWVV